MVTQRQIQQQLLALKRDWPVGLPFERAVRSQFAPLRTLIQSGVAWKAIAEILRELNVRKKDGKCLSAQHINTVFLRVSKDQKRPVIKEPSRQQTVVPETPAVLPRLSSPIPSPKTTSPQTPSTLRDRLQRARQLGESSQSKWDDT